MARTWPFIVLRLVVYFGITVAYIRRLSDVSRKFRELKERALASFGGSERPAPDASPA